ncbi:MAG TPA: type II 3-dehydroquinate dehydratase [Propionibacteriaceae bacterium]|jgi:3-dehydroquinate dehydratase-2|nr:type II 3-dehydroquinate dehydratase [Propionibacteriaceae bacterium]
MTTVYVLNGPNLNLLGLREPEIYGKATLADVEQSCLEVANELGWDLAFRQTNREGELIDWVQEVGWAQSAGDAVGAVLNAAGYTHTSVALHDAIAGSGARVIELHISNVFSREQFRHHSYVSPGAAGIIAGFGVAGYPLALRALATLSS